MLLLLSPHSPSLPHSFYLPVSRTNRKEEEKGNGRIYWRPPPFPLAIGGAPIFGGCLGSFISSPVPIHPLFPFSPSSFQKKAEEKEEGECSLCYSGLSRLPVLPVLLVSSPLTWSNSPIKGPCWTLVTARASLLGSAALVFRGSEPGQGPADFHSRVGTLPMVPPMAPEPHSSSWRPL